MSNRPSIAIVGAGAVGGYYGGRLAQHGYDVHFLLRSDFERWRNAGLRVKSIDGDFELSPQQFHVYNNAATMPKVDLVIITLKTTENGHLQPLVTPLLHDRTAILTLQNGLGNEQTLADLFGPSRVTGCIAFTCINRTAPGVIDHSDYGHLRIGEMIGPATERVRAMVEMFTASKVRAEAIDDLRHARWDKQVWNVAFNGLGALLDMTTDRLLATDDGTALVRAIMEEVVEAATVDGIQLDPKTPEQKIRMTRSVGAYLTSTQVDRRLRKRMEVEAIFGQPVHIARRSGKQVPLLEMLYYALRQLDYKASDNMR
jgi:2-dehydropantoate 2-reductase